MQALDYFKTQDEKIAKVGDTVWTDTPLKVLKIVTKDYWMAIERNKRVEHFKERKEEYRKNHKELLEVYNRKPSHKSYWYHTFIFDENKNVREEHKNLWNWTGFDPDFDIYWANKIKLIRDGYKNNPPEFPENNTPMVYVCKFKNDKSTAAFGWWTEVDLLFYDPTKIPVINLQNIL